MKKEPIPIRIEEELHRCPQCGYEDGFHMSFIRREKKKTGIILICPSCHARYDPDWSIEY
ncbi:hypothetical protein KsCSTR_36630 [Candidatus Kuenenia stuttgartiensis]|jgi:DNA-directed RNA polymerase subunit M/transcription elongation factor TFIIS|uniref:Uncharacterized protein n=1 Tax=Kuenenia stuttgartiensis TaxID=174633 RepID=Q1Q6F7_KUEST|nr:MULTISPECIES: hypothetical protein [Kuenenia]MBE7548384.1 hypothetical protein [Planctomycetia bacterium]MBW7943064.1 hypothetical protein [Candidatus Kuenenia stuttgartiensis]MBZ0192421.1 hypothetical protein [Candidatus Kuenenia stuttgartiensis]MCF6150774.1 hypothetical protein [Candidatus Kuenenia stuttgartiensis]MCL4726296.1 hypothetical protein [Candidatus Kuenenia stuttgartiensis]